jgi:FAD/FMN-containing dehydrogenase
MPVDLSGLRAGFRGTIVTPYDPSYEGARVVFNNRVRTRPAVLCQSRSTEDVVTAVRFAREAGLPVSVRGGGHHACGFSLVDDGLVLDMRSMRDIRVNLDDGTVTTGPGNGWRDLDQVTYLTHGLAVPGGECPTVSNAGYSLGGGFGFLSRTYGLGCDHILAAELVDADGLVRNVTEDEHPELLWALRGAGGAGFGVVTSLTYRLDPVPMTVLGGVMAWSLDDAEAALRAYRDLYTDPRGEPALALPRVRHRPVPGRRPGADGVRHVHRLTRGRRGPPRAAAGGRAAGVRHVRPDLVLRPAAGARPGDRVRAPAQVARRVFPRRRVR